MKAVILPTKNPGLLSPICNWTSDYLIPVVNKPIAEHLLELLLENGVRDIRRLPFRGPTDTSIIVGKRTGAHKE